MPIRYRCEHCDQLLSIGTRMAGREMPCPSCRKPTHVPIPDVATPKADAEEDEPAFKKSERSCEFGELDLTPMVDVTMLLLIFFILTASFIQQKTIETAKQKSAAEQGAGTTMQENEPEDVDDVMVTLRISSRSEFFLDDAPVDGDGLVDALRGSRTRERTDVLIDAHAEATHEAFVKALDAANEVGFERIRSSTKDESD